MRVDINHSLLRRATLLETQTFSDQVTKTEEFLLCFDNGSVMFIRIRTSAELESVIILCNSIKELVEKVKDIDHITRWYKKWKKRNDAGAKVEVDIRFGEDTFFPH